MNRIFKVIWSKTKNCYVVASELAKGRTKAASTGDKAKRLALAAITALMLLPVGGYSYAADTTTVKPAGTGSTTVVEVYTKEGTDKQIEAANKYTYRKAAELNKKLTDQKTSTALHISSSGDLIVGTKENYTVKDMEIRGKLTSGSISTGGITSTGDVTVAGKMAADGVTDETTKDGTYVKQNNTVGNNLVSLDKQVKANDDRITNVKEYLEQQTSDKYVSKADAAVQDGAIVKAANTIGDNVTKLDAALASETAARIGADKAQDKVIQAVNDNLVQSVTTINKNVADGFTALNQAYANEAAAREAKDNELNERITNEANAIHDEIKAGDEKLNTRITNVKEYLEQQTSDKYVSKADAAVQDGAIVKANKTIGENVTNLDAALASETAARIGADKAQDKVIQQVNQNMVDGFNTINTNMANGFAALNAADAAEKEARIGADKKLAEAVNSGLSLSDDNVLQKNTTTVADDGTVTTSKSDANEMILNKGNKNQITLNEKGIKVGTNSSVMDADGIYTGGDTFDAAKAAMSSDGQIKGANGKFTVDASGNTTVTSLDAGTGTIQTKGDLYAKDATFSGDITAKDATLSGDLSAKDGTFSGDLSAKDGTFSGDVSAKDVTATGTLQGAEVTDGTATLKQGKLTGVKDIETEALHVNGDANVTGKLTTKDLEVTGEFNANTLKSRLDENNYTEIHGGNVTSKNLKVDKGVIRTSESSFDENGREEYVTDNDSRATVKVGANEISQTLDDKGDTSEKQSTFRQRIDQILQEIKSANGSTSVEQTDVNITNTAKNGTITNDAQNLVNKASDSITSQIGDGSAVKSVMDANGIANTATGGTISNSAADVINTGTNSVINQVGDNQVAVKTDSVKAAYGSDTSTTWDAKGITNTTSGDISNSAANISNTTTGNMTNTVGGNLIDTIMGTSTTTVTGKVTEDYKSDLSTKVGGDETHAVTGNQTTTVSGNRTVNVKGTETENFNALETNVKTDQKTSVGGNQTNIVGGDQQNTVSGSKTETVKGSVTEKYGSQATTVDGDQSTNIGGNQTTVVAKDQTNTVSGNKTETVKGAVNETYGSQTTKVNGDQSTTVTGKQTNIITGDQVNTIGGNQTTTVTGDSSLTAENITNEAKNKITNKAIDVETDATSSIVNKVSNDAGSNTSTQLSYETKEEMSQADGKTASYLRGAAEEKSQLTDGDKKTTIDTVAGQTNTNITEGKNISNSLQKADQIASSVTDGTNTTVVNQDAKSLASSITDGTKANNTNNTVDKSEQLIKASDTQYSATSKTATKTEEALVNGSTILDVVKDSGTGTISAAVTDGTNTTGSTMTASGITNTTSGDISNSAANISNTTTGNMTNTVGGNLIDTIMGTSTTTVTGKVTEDYKSDLSTKVGGDETHAVTGNQTTTVSGNRTVNVKGTETENFNALETNVKTDQKTSVGGNQTTVVAKDQTNTVSGNKTETVKGAVNETYGSQTTKVNGDQSTTVTGKQTNSITGDQVNTIGGSQTTTVTGDSSLSAQNITNTASEKITNQIGDGSAVKSEMTADGITNTAEGGTIYNKSKDILNEASGDILNFADGEIGNVATKITNITGDNTVTSDTNGTTFENKAHNTAIKEGTVTKTTISGNTIETGQATMDYAEVMKDLGVHGNATVDQKLTVKGDSDLQGNANVGKNLTVNGTSDLKGNVTMESNATVQKDLTVNGTTTTNKLVVNNGATIKGGTTTDTLHVTSSSTFDGAATFKDVVTMEKDLSVGGNATVAGSMTASSYKVGDKTYISESGINANNQKVVNVAAGDLSANSTDAVNGAQLYQTNERVTGVENKVNKLDSRVDKVGANAAALANLHPLEFDADSKWNIAAAVGGYKGETATAIGAFYRPNENVMVNVSSSFGTGENMYGGGISLRIGQGGNKARRNATNGLTEREKAMQKQIDSLTSRLDALLSVINPNMSKDFPDVPENHWAYEAVSRLAGNGVIQGYEDGKYHGDRTMTRYEMAEIIYNALSKGAKAEKKLVEEFKPELQAMAAQKKA
ncbi:ESPR-type extended signal peptide-containing protein [Megasphaera elsdenii]|nr:ESPR-type extended signal peptide-containing protein [Megasphaera elsdenii]